MKESLLDRKVFTSMLPQTGGCITETMQKLDRAENKEKHNAPDSERQQVAQSVDGGKYHEEAAIEAVDVEHDFKSGRRAYDYIQP